MLYPCGTRLERHAHKKARFTLSIDGGYSESSGGESFDCGPRGVVFHAAGDAHAITVGNRALRSFLLEIEDDVDGPYSRVSGVGSLETLLYDARLLHAAGGPLAAIMGALYSELRCLDDCSSIAVEGLVLQLIATAARLCHQMADEQGRPPWLERTAELLHERFRSGVTIQEISNAVGVSPSRLSMAFRKAYHRTIGEEQRRLRIEFATGRLSEPDTSLAEIALEAGFSDQAHFCRAFKDTTGMTPARYRGAISGCVKSRPFQKGESNMARTSAARVGGAPISGARPGDTSIDWSDVEMNQ
jgi:AraC family transcriptional regulator